MEVYRFRSMDYLLGDEYQELEKQTIYFASPDQLNDPMEGFRDIVWRGDKIVWTNFFKHYVYCLTASYWRHLIAGDSEELGVDDIPIQGRRNQLPIVQIQKLYDDISRRFFNLPRMPEVVEALANSKHKIRYRELGYYLQCIHSVFIEEIIDSYFAHGLISESKSSEPLDELPVSQPPELPAQVMLAKLLESIKVFEEANTEEDLNIILQQIEVMDNNNRINRQRIIQKDHNLFSTETLRKNSQLVIDHFPKIYLKEVERLLWPNWYTVCFMKHYHNSSAWGHYADKHSGACLIFESKQIGESDGFELYYGTGNSTREIRLSEIIYKNKPAEVGFFRSIGRLTGMDVMDYWYTDEEGNTSECGSHIPRDGDMDSDEMVDWRNRHLSAFYRDITVKTKDWKYEQEYRLILEDGLSEFKEGKSRALRYDFNSLKGIIFGIKTSDDHRLQIIEIIKKKCKKHDRTDFKFYQADYSPETGDIRKFEVQVDDMP